MRFTKTTIGLFIGALIVAGLNLYIFKDRLPETIEVQGVGDLALPVVAGREADIIKVVLAGPEGKTTLLKTPRGWVIEEKGGFPAAGSRVADLILGLKEARKFEPRTAEERFFERLGLTDRFIEITLFDDSGSLATLKTGDQFFDPTGAGVLTFGFDPGSNRAWTFSGLPEVSLDPVFWMSRDLLYLSDLRLKSLEVKIGADPPWRITRTDPMATDFHLQGTDPILTNLAVVNKAALAASAMTFDDVTEGPPAGLLKIAEARFETFDGLSVSMEFFDSEGAILAALKATYDETVLLAEDTPALLHDVPPDGAAEAEALNALWQGHLFQIPVQKLADFLKFRNEFLNERRQ